MALNLDQIKNIFPVTWFVKREYGADICVCTNTGNLDGEDEDYDENNAFQYVLRANAYHEHFASGKSEKLVMVTDSVNTAFKMSFLLAGDDKNLYVDKSQFADGEEGYAELSNERDGVLIARYNMHDNLFENGSFPEFSVDLDGAFFYGAENEEDIIKNLNTILSCDLPFVSVAIDENLWHSDTISSLLFDYPFVYLDVRELGTTEGELKKILEILLESNDLNEMSVDELFDTVKKVRKDSLTEEDIISIIEYRIRENILSDEKISDPAVLFDSWS